ncbi:MAG TPA: hypothetical protein VFM05_11515 [Candidatus Saccharimonadales bacterium]|nr:hypothetical protein [Candidatus Saccharimonadales bacterium]
MDNRFYLQALGVTGLFVTLMILLWSASGGPASEAAVQNANNTRTAIAMTGSYLLQPRTSTPPSLSATPTSLPPTISLGSTSTVPSVPSATNTSLLAQLNTPISPVSASSTPFPTQTAVAQIPTTTTTVSTRRENTKAPPLSHQPTTPTAIQIIPQSPTSAPPVIQDPAEFARWYFTRVWNERDYQNLWDNYLSLSYKTNVGSGIFEDYVWWWNSVARVDVNSVDVLENNGRDARVRVNLTFHMQDGRVVQNQVYEYDFLYDPSRATWMFDASS